MYGRVGCDHDDPHPLPDQPYAALVGGPLDGLLLDITGRRPEEVDDGVTLMTAGVVARRPGVVRPARRRPAPLGRPGCGVPFRLLR